MAKLSKFLLQKSALEPCIIAEYFCRRMVDGVAL